MNIINLDLESNLYKDSKVILDRVSVAFEEFNKSETKISYNFYGSLDSIPVFLVKSSSMEDVTNDYLVRLEDQIKITLTPTIESDLSYYGVLANKQLGYGKEVPAFYICPERILNNSKNAQDFVFLLETVIVYLANKRVFRSTVEDDSPLTEFFYWMEESIASYLSIFYCSDKIINDEYSKLSSFQTFKNLKEYKLNFFTKSSAPLALGAYLNRGVYPEWDRWYYCNNKLKTGLVSQENWLNYVKENYNNIDKEVYRKLFKDLEL